jgi:hypothetical protein
MEQVPQGEPPDLEERAGDSPDSEELEIPLVRTSVVVEPDDQEPSASKESVMAWTLRCRRHPRVLIGATILSISLLTFFIAMIEMAPRDSRSRSITHLIEANDLYALHDLVLVGYTAVFMKAGSEGQQHVRNSALNLTQALPVLHPYSACRSSLAALDPSSTTRKVDAVAAVADRSWTCLPGRFKPADFNVVFSKDAFDNPTLQNAARNPILNDPSVLGACAASRWMRTCSYWSVIHSIALRSESVLLSRDSVLLLQLLITIAGGVTQCRG